MWNPGKNAQIGISQLQQSIEFHVDKTRDNKVVVGFIRNSVKTSFFPT